MHLIRDTPLFLPVLAVSGILTILLILAIQVDTTLQFKSQSVINFDTLTHKLYKAEEERQQIQDDITKMETHLLELMYVVDTYNIDSRNFD